MRSHHLCVASFLLVCLSLTEFVATAAEPAGDWKSLFNGRDLTGWRVIDGNASDWSAADGILSCRAGGGGWLATKEEYKNFELKLEFRVPTGGNSGVFLRAPEQGNPAFAGMEIQVLDDDASIYAGIKPAQHCGSLYGLAAPKTRASKKAGEWQSYLIVCDGPHVKVTLNDTLIVDANLADFKGDETHPGAQRTGGLIGLQHHDTSIEYRNIAVHALP
jgi:hypothetical protein